MQHRIFISHSTHETADTPILDKLVEVLAPKFELFVDKTNLRLGDTWRPKLIRALGICDGAVVLINERALDPEKKWVETEANILRWRKWNEPDFPLLLVRVGNVTTERIAKLWPALDFTGLQMLPKGNAQLTADALANSAEVLNEITAVLQPLADRSRMPGPFESMRDAIANLFQAAVGEANVKHVCIALAQMGLADEQINQGNAWKLLADVLIEKGPDPAHVVTLKQYLGTFFLLNEPGLKRLADILDLIVPHWVSPIAASKLANLPKPPAQVPIFGINAVHPKFTGAHYLQRACCRAAGLEWKHVEVQPKVGSKTVEAVLSQIREGLRQRFNRGFQKLRVLDPDDTELKRRLARSREPVFVMLPPPLSTNERVINAIRNSFGELVVLCFTGEDFQTIPAPKVTYIEPPLTKGEELLAYNNYQDALDAI